jgi:hypothetical protein
VKKNKLEKNYYKGSYEEWKKLPMCGSVTPCAFKLSSGKCEFPEPFSKRCKDRVFPNSQERVEFT